MPIVKRLFCESTEFDSKESPRGEGKGRPNPFWRQTFRQAPQKGGRRNKNKKRCVALFCGRDPFAHTYRKLQTGLQNRWDGNISQHAHTHALHVFHSTCLRWNVCVSHGGRSTFPSSRRFLRCGKSHSLTRSLTRQLYVRCCWQRMRMVFEPFIVKGPCSVVDPRPRVSRPLVVLVWCLVRLSVCRRLVRCHLGVSWSTSRGRHGWLC